MKKKDFIKPKEPKTKGKYVDPVKAMKTAFKKPQKVAKVGGVGYV